MAKRVEEIMNRELFSLRQSDTVDEALAWIVNLGVSGAPVTDSYGKAVGVASFRDLLTRRRGKTVGDCMTSPPVTVKRGTDIEQAGRLLGERGFHRLVVVDDEGLTVGVVSALDIVRALVGLPASHPASFPHFDCSTGLTWTDDVVFDREHLSAAPTQPGILVLCVGGAREQETDVWIEGASDVRRRLGEILARPAQDRRLSKLLERYAARLRFRAAAIPDPVRRRQALDRLREEADVWVWTRAPEWER